MTSVSLLSCAAWSIAGMWWQTPRQVEATAEQPGADT
jgi:hypothetical protein